MGKPSKLVMIGRCGVCLGPCGSSAGGATNKQKMPDGVVSCSDRDSVTMSFLEEWAVSLEQNTAAVTRGPKKALSSLGAGCRCCLVPVSPMISHFFKSLALGNQASRKKRSELTACHVLPAEAVQTSNDLNWRSMEILQKHSVAQVAQSCPRP